ncbi:hypothetical protein GCM10009525_04890 [Streptosporangium amethystogenes subsp. fukuiense]
MRAQLEHIAAIACPRISVQVVPSGHVRSGLLAGFAIAPLEDGGEVAYLETAIRGLTTGHRDDITMAVQRFEAIRIQALPPNMSTDLIKRTAEEKWT